MREAIDITRAEHLSVKAEPGTAPIAAEAASDASEALAPVLTQASGAAGGGPTLRLMTFNILNMCMEPVLPRGALAKLADPSFLRNRGGVPSEWFTRKRLKGRKNKCLAAALIHDASPDVLCLTEVASLAVLDYFNRDCLPALGYRYAVLVEGHEDAGMNVGLLSRFPIASYVLHRDDVNRAVFPRGVLEADLDVEGHMLTVYACHFKAQTDRANANEAAGAKRRLQAVHLSNLIDRRWAAVGFVGNFVVMGDLNDTPTSDALSPLLARREWVDVMSRLPQHHRWTHCYLRGPQPAYSQLDYIVASLALASSQSNCMRKPVVLRHGMRTAVSAYRGSRYEAVSDAVFASDHAPVYVDLTLLKVTQWPYLASVPMVAAPPAPKGPYMPREEFWEPQAIYRPSMVPRLTSLALSSNAEDIDSDLEICSVVPHFIDLSDEDDDVIIVEDPDDVIIDQHVPVAVLQQSEPIELD
jgi:endonuclease/exonuclease/phosphatase family metal-dependent hydrolase